jgi:hypothetical protein
VTAVQEWLNLMLLPVNPLSSIYSAITHAAFHSFRNHITADTDGRGFVASVAGNNNFIIKQNVRFDVVPNNFPLEGRELAICYMSLLMGENIVCYLLIQEGTSINASTDGTNFVKEKVIVPPSAGGCNSVLSPKDNVLLCC